MRRLGALLAALSTGAFLAGALLAGVAPPAVAEDLWVGPGAVSGNRVSFIVGLPGTAALDPSSEIGANVVIDGATLPAEAAPVSAPAARSVIVMLDTSGSMRGGRLVQARSAILRLVGELPESIRMGLGTFDDRARILVEPTFDRDRIVEALADLNAGGSTALYDGVGRAIASGADRVILVSDGADTASRLSLPRLLDGSAGTPVDVVAIAPKPDERDVLQQIAAAAGGTLTSTASDEIVAAIVRAGQVFGPRIAITAALPSAPPARADVVVTVTVDGRSWSGQSRLPAAPSPEVTSPEVTSPAVTGPAPAEAAGPPNEGRWPSLLLAGGAGTAVALLVFAGSSLVAGERRRGRTAALLDEYAPRPLQDEAPTRRSSPWTSWSQRLVGSRSHATLVAQLDRAELPLTPLAWIVLRIAGMAVLGIALALLLRSALFGLLIGGVLAWIGEEIFFRQRISSRLKAFEAELPDFLTLMASGLRSGLSVTQAVANAGSDNSNSPRANSGSTQLARQMRRALLEVQMGASLDEALMRVADRMDSTDLRWTVQALSIQREVGGSLATILDTAAATIRERAALRREVRALSAEGRLSANILLALPILVFAFLALTRRDYLQIFWTEPIGYLMLAMVGMLLIVGTLWIRSITRLQV